MNKKQIAKHMITVGIFTLITTFVIVSLESYRNLTKEKAEVGQGLNLDPMDSQMETDVLDEIESRKEYSLEEIRTISTPTPFPTVTPGQTETALGEETTISTSSGEQADE